MGMEQSNEARNSSNESSSANRAANTQQELMQLQAKLMMLSYQNHHPDIQVDIDHPRQNLEPIRKAATMEWMTDGNAQNFRESFEREDFDLNKLADLSTILEKISKPDTIH
jgi:hypothetical protein